MNLGGEFYVNLLRKARKAHKVSGFILRGINLIDSVRSIPFLNISPLDKYVYRKSVTLDYFASGNPPKASNNAGMKCSNSPHISVKSASNR